MKQDRVLLAATAAVTLAAAGWWVLASKSEQSGQLQQAEQPQSKAAAPKPAAGMLLVEPAKAQALGIVLAEAKAAGEAPLADLPATIAPPPNARVAVPATLPGVVLRTFVVEGDAVRAGQPLATVASRDVLTLGADLSRANARLGVARSSAARLSQLSREGIIAGGRADEARALAAEAGADVSEKARILRMVGGHGGSGTYTLSAPIAGRVTKADILAGSPVDGTSAPFVIDAEGRYEIVAQVPERLVGTLRPGMGLRVGDSVGTVTAVGTTIDPMTRSATLKAQIPAGPGAIAGRAATVTVLGPAPAGAVTVPTSALTRIGSDDAVFVAGPKGYAVRKVRSAGGDASTVVLLSGVRAGEKVVVSGTSALKALAQTN
ncbi:efflux RND transporter periplasmic adaptor subunit [Novosphingobium sp. KCTC 2891]|uniref:efflux RND transporter periplasmic adaptor subunit n=1 Tax=Novosphingobium sp. KCTC 2891 TaxID=2989730 RepID=UPI00222223A0|nr:efflux RND transporter periplasmic adaptor subunit [Novosphingobium sp. KCTC 2891]MCW1382534.1 efflux RND transporter periplasmic adaptor subunit [Novosphingobium sp. KCTC 2891]